MIKVVFFFKIKKENILKLPVIRGGILQGRKHDGDECEEMKKTNLMKSIPFIISERNYPKIPKDINLLK
jgi:hypothetical protein